MIIGDGSAPIEGGTVVIRDGNIVSAGANVAVPAGAQSIDATGKWVTPGIFAGFSRLGLSEVDAVNGTNDKGGQQKRVFSGARCRPRYRSFSLANRGKPLGWCHPRRGCARSR